MGLKLGSTNIADLYLGTTPVQAVYLGPIHIWDRWPMSDQFNVIGWLFHWINELCEDPGGLFHDPYGTIVDGIGNTVGYMVNFVEGGLNQTGTLISGATAPLVEAYCGMWGQTAPPNGLIGLVNGIPVIGGVISDWLSGTLDIESVLGQLPVIGELGKMIGVIPDAITGALQAPINFLVDAAGAVLGTISCGRYTSIGGLEEDICYAIRVFELGARINIPDGLVALPPQFSQYRFGDAVAAADDGPLETMVSAIGDIGYATQLFRRYSNDGTGNNGVGIQLLNSGLSIVRRVGGTATTVAQGGAFAVGDLLRLEQVGDTHTLLRNGTQVAQWIDSGATAAVGAANRSMGMIMEGAKDLTGPRRFSPALAFARAA